MYRTLTLLTFLLLPLHDARADAWYELIRYTCNPAQDVVKVEYVGAYNEIGRAMHENMTKNEWDPWSLIVGDTEGRIKKLITVQRTCKLRKGIYQVTVGPWPCNFNPQGFAGAMMMAQASISQKGIKLVSANFGACDIGDFLVVTSIAAHSNPESSVVERKPANDYFQ